MTHDTTKTTYCISVRMQCPVDGIRALLSICDYCMVKTFCWLLCATYPPLYPRYGAHLGGLFFLAEVLTSVKCFFCFCLLTTCPCLTISSCYRSRHLTCVLLAERRTYKYRGRDERRGRVGDGLVPFFRRGNISAPDTGRVLIGFTRLLPTRLLF